MTHSQKLTEQTLSRLRAYAKGNGIKAEDIQLIESNEATLTVPAKLTLTPHCDVKSRSSLGRIKGKAYKVLSSFAELHSEVAALQKDFQENAPWLNEAIEELEKTPGHGWGQHSALLCWSDKKTIIGASENCPTCRGTAQRTCPDCRGLSSTPCHNCESRGRELCLQCAGHTQDPTNPKNKCPMCNGTGYSLCRFCQGNMKLPCATCQGRGNTPCGDCKGTGHISQEVEITKGARMDFTLGSTSGLPSGLLRGLSRLGDDKLIKGHATFVMKPELPDAEDTKKASNVIINLEAQIPYADIKIKFGPKGAIISCFGKQGRLSGVPPFLDAGLTAARKVLADAAKTDGNIAQALSARAIKDAFELVLAGKTHPNDLRRQYPVGLSGEAAKEIMGNLTRYLRASTAQMRLIASGVSVLICAILFAALFFTPAFASMAQNLSAPVSYALKAALLVFALGASWAGLRQTTAAILKQRFKGVRVAPSQPIGKTGAAALGAVTFIYIVILLLSGNLI